MLTKHRFYQLANFPSIVGVIDCTCVRITAAKENEADFVNRKNYHSVKTQPVFDADYKINQPRVQVARICA